MKQITVDARMRIEIKGLQVQCWMVKAPKSLRFEISTCIPDRQDEMQRFTVGT